MIKRRAIVRWDVRALKELLFLPGNIIGMRLDPFNVGVVEIKLEGEELFAVGEGAPVPYIDIEVVETHAFWIDQHGTKHRVVL